MIKVSAPGKLMLFGEHAVVYNRPCIVTSVDRRITVSLAKRNDHKICLNAPDINVKGSIISTDYSTKSYPKEVRFVLTAVKNFFDKYGLKNGLEIETKSRFSNEFGLGSSSAVTAATIKGLSMLFEVKMNDRELFNLSYKTILDIQGVGSGFDIAAAIYGGTLFFVTAGKLIEPVKVKDFPIVVGYTGIKADTPTLVKKVSKRLLKNSEKINKIFDEITKIVNSSRSEIEDSNWKRVGELMNLNQELLRKLGVSSKELENLISLALSAGAYGAKLSGAGGGDCMIAIADNRNLNNVKKEIERAGGKVIEAKISVEGIKLEQDR